jgi:hypothetical protein
MALHQPTMVHHVLPWWLELVGAGIIGAALLFSALLVAGHSDLLPTTGTEGPSISWMSPDLQQFRQGEILGR